MGTTSARQSQKQVIQDHPHIRGDHSFRASSTTLRMGSPPHTWGPLTMGSPCQDLSRITPTYVGTTGLFRWEIHPCQDHPHIRGDHNWPNSRARPSVGSPPHTWGPLHTEFLSPASDRITPTYVGTTEFGKIRISVIKDHPHIRGDHFLIFFMIALYIGSPPHTWGPQTPNSFRLLLIGITPTYVGTTKQ